MEEVRKTARQLGRAYFTAATLALLVVVLLLLGVWEPWERLTYDWRYQLRGEYPVQAEKQPPIVIVAITEETLKKWQREPRQQELQQQAWDFYLVEFFGLLLLDHLAQ